MRGAKAVDAGIKLYLRGLRTIAPVDRDRVAVRDTKLGEGSGQRGRIPLVDRARTQAQIAGIEYRWEGPRDDAGDAEHDEAEIAAEILISVG